MSKSGKQQQRSRWRGNQLAAVALIQSTVADTPYPEQRAEVAGSVTETWVPTALPVPEGHLSPSPLHFMISLQNKECVLLGVQETGIAPLPFQPQGQQVDSKTPPSLLLDHSQQPAEGTSNSKDPSGEGREIPKKESFPRPSDSSCRDSPCTSSPNQLLSQDSVCP